MKKKRPRNLLALAVLVLLYERPMHPYEMASTLKERREEESIKLRYGSLYTVIDALQAAGLIEPRETQREGRRPERTVFGITSRGEHELKRWMADLLGRPVKEYPSFKAALSLMPVLPPEEAAGLLEQRAERLEARLAMAESELAEAKKEMGLPDLFIIEEMYEMAILRAEHDFVADLASRIREGDIEGMEFWKEIHAVAPEARAEVVDRLKAALSCQETEGCRQGSPVGEAA
jgi:DNA-binding PadR family transcriptional regulator